MYSLSGTLFRLSEPLISLSDGGLEILTTNPESEARDLLSALTGARQYFQQLGLIEDSGLEPIKIFSFKTKGEYEKFAIGSGSFGHYIHGSRGDFIVLQDIHPQHRQAALHEFTHAVMRQDGMTLPVWLSEGLADVYSSLAWKNGEFTVGAPLASRLRALETHPWLQLKPMLAVQNEQALFQRGDQVTIFYGQSWALTHMLCFGAYYASGFARFLETVAAGEPSDQALAEVYGKDLDSIAADLHRYAAAGEFKPVWNRKSPACSPTGRLAALTEDESLQELANLAGALPWTRVRTQPAQHGNGLQSSALLEP